MRQSRVDDMPARRTPIDLDELIQAVMNERGSRTELERLNVAVRYGELLSGLGDELVGHFVEQARQAGASWSQIGERLGVSKQAAHQRHLRRTPWYFPARRSRGRGQGPLARFTQEAKDVIVKAQEEARSLGHNYLGAEHLLLALTVDPNVGPLLRAAGASRKAVLKTVREIVGDGTEPPVGAIPFTPRAKRALEIAAKTADRSESLVRPSHLLVGLLELRDGVGAEVLDALNVSRDELRRGATEGEL
jgi:Clp amino terminal domain, pathogenicity island component